MYEKYLDVLAKAAKKVFTDMANTEVLKVQVKRDQRIAERFGVAQVIEYADPEDKIKGQFILGLSDEPMAIYVASAIAEELGLPPVQTMDEVAYDVLAELTNTIAGHAVAAWGKLGLPVRFGTPRPLTGQAASPEGYRTEQYVIILTLPLNFLVFKVTFSEPRPKEKAAAKILVVDDSLVIRSVLSQNLEETGYIVAQAKDGQEAVDKYHQFKPDLTIMDLIMPRMGGLEAMMEIQAKDAAARFIVLSSASGKDEVVTAKTIGVVSYLIKPLNMELMLEKIEKVLCSD